MAAMSVAFLRGINLGRRRVTNDQLVAAAEAAGFAEVSAYQAAGNLLFDLGGVPDPEATLSAGLERALGFEVRVFVRAATTLAELAAAAPFTEAELAGGGKVQVTMLSTVPTPEQAAAVHALATEQDRLVVRGAHWFWLPALGVGRSTLDVSAIEREVGVGTTRTQGTVQRLVKKLGA